MNESGEHGKPGVYRCACGNEEAEAEDMADHIAELVHTGEHFALNATKVVLDE